MKVHKVQDHQHQMVAAALEHPDVWQAESMVRWNFQHWSAPIKLFARTFDPVSGLGVEFFPVEQFCWLQPDFMMRPPGMDLNDGTHLLPPMPVVDAFQGFIVPRYRPHLQGFRIAKVTPAPDLMQRLDVRNLNGAQTEGVSILTEYVIGGQQVEEEFFILKYMFQGIPSYGAAGQIMQYNWGFGRMLSFRAPKGQLGPNRENLWSIVRTLKINPQWEQVCNQVINQMQMLFQQHLQAGYANIQAATQMSHQISAMNDQWLQHQEQRRQQEYASDQMRLQQSQSSSGSYTQSDAFGDMMMGRETYEDSYYQSGTSQHGYWDYVYTNDQGEYKYSNTPLTDPSAGESTTFHQMKKKQIGE